MSHNGDLFKEYSTHGDIDKYQEIIIDIDGSWIEPNVKIPNMLIFPFVEYLLSRDDLNTTIYGFGIELYEQYLNSDINVYELYDIAITILKNSKVSKVRFDADYKLSFTTHEDNNYGVYETYPFINAPITVIASDLVEQNTWYGLDEFNMIVKADGIKPNLINKLKLIPYKVRNIFREKKVMLKK